ncbi:MAG: hypothetical protein ACI4MJ_01170 [Aristaeellaceae bacterium]
MANMKTMGQDERAKLARAYMNGGMPPYQAARQMGFMRVAIMNEAIRAMEGREAEAEKEKHGETVEDIAKEIEMEATEVEQAGERSLEKAAEPVYPFLKPDEKRSGIEFSVSNGRYWLHAIGENGKVVAINSESRKAYLTVALEDAEGLAELLGMYVRVARMKEEGASKA